MKTWDPVDIAWVAGIIEGEGCISVRHAKDSQKAKSPRPWVVCTVAMNDFDVVQRLHDVTGIGNVCRARVYPQKPSWNPTLKWTVAKQKDLARLLLAIAPLMGERRRQKTLEAAGVLGLVARRHAIAHGTPRGYNQERYRGLKTCDACRAAKTAEHRAYLQSRILNRKPAEAPANA